MLNAIPRMGWVLGGFVSLLVIAILITVAWQRFSPSGVSKTAPAGASRLTVTGGAIGGTASARMHTTPGASCTITYIHPSGKTSTLSALAPKTAGSTGVVSWTWSIDPATKPPGQGTVTVACGSDQATQSITISPAVAVPTP